MTTTTSRLIERARWETEHPLTAITYRNIRPEDKSCYLYLMPCTYRYVKIGVSFHPRSRLSSIQSHSPHLITLMALIQTPSEQLAYEREVHWHGVYQTKRVGGEWFELNTHDIRRLLDEERVNAQREDEE